MSVILWRKNDGHSATCSLNVKLASFSSLRPSAGGIAYQVFGAPKIDQIRLKFLSNYANDLCHTKMEVIDAVKFHVFCMPRKSGFPHAKIQVACIDTWDGFVIVFLHII